LADSAEIWAVDVGWRIGVMDEEKARELGRRIGHVAAELCVCLGAYSLFGSKGAFFAFAVMWVLNSYVEILARTK